MMLFRLPGTIEYKQDKYKFFNQPKNNNKMKEVYIYININI